MISLNVLNHQHFTGYYFDCSLYGECTVRIWPVMQVASSKHEPEDARELTIDYKDTDTQQTIYYYNFHRVCGSYKMYAIIIHQKFL